jgi:hypothetical protein
MAGKRRRQTGEGMTPLFDLAPLMRDDPNERAVRRTVKSPEPALLPYPIPNWIRGNFRYTSGAERTRTVEGQALSHRRDSDIERFIGYLRENGWQFPDGRAVLVAVFGVGAHDGGTILLSAPARGDEAAGDEC